MLNYLTRLATAIYPYLLISLFSPNCKNIVNIIGANTASIAISSKSYSINIIY
ncbi:hypothetical protein FEV09_13450 [Pseudanabaena catenata USMAC16]|uniref:Uncharacterized protein n=1 Tax=Pseudanabaena catenata USMAC16 TaxID=1855837 RepID=A0A9X4RIE5_9CYAN|nr:hypothetical protein [Pseudanabaena catenata]MDG3495556.1 hypothetical protein [Pseudanabaena catenata USMAC16]